MRGILRAFFSTTKHLTTRHHQPPLHRASTSTSTRTSTRTSSVASATEGECNGWHTSARPRRLAKKSGPSPSPLRALGSAPAASNRAAHSAWPPYLIRDPSPTAARPCGDNYTRVRTRAQSATRDDKPCYGSRETATEQQITAGGHGGAVNSAALCAATCMLVALLTRRRAGASQGRRRWWQPRSRAPPAAAPRPCRARAGSRGAAA